MRLTPTPRWRSDLVELFLLEPRHVTDAYVSWLNDTEVNRYLESRFVVQDLRGVGVFVEAALADAKTLFLGIRSAALNRHVGNVKLGPIDRNHGLGEIGIMIGDRDARGVGVGSAALACLAEISAHELGLRKLTAGCYASNVGSVRAFAKAGFHVEATRPRHFMLGGRPEDLILLARDLRL